MEIERKKLTRLVDIQLSAADDVIQNLIAVQSQIHALWRRIREGVKEGVVAQEDCVAMAQLWAEYHPLADKANYGGRVTHGIHSILRVDGANEGQKDCEPWC